MLKKYLIHIDGSSKHQQYALYLCHLLHDIHDEIEFNVITPTLTEVNFTKLSPFEVQLFQYEEGQLNSMPQAHKFAFNLHDVFNIDVFIDFMDTATSAFLGTAFKAKQRIGVYSRIRSLLLTDSIKTNEFETFFNSVLSTLDLNLDLEKVQKDFEILGHDVLLYKVNLDRDKVKELANYCEVYEVERIDREISENVLGALDNIQYVITEEKSLIGIFQYLNKIVVLPNQDEIDPPIDGVINLETLISQISTNE